MLKIWCDREIDPGVKWEQAIIDNMDVADMILLMVNAAYYNFSYIHRHQTSKAHLKVGLRLETSAQKEFRGMLSKRNKKTRYGWSGVYWPTISSRTFNEIERFEEIMARVWDI